MANDRLSQKERALIEAARQATSNEGRRAPSNDARRVNPSEVPHRAKPSEVPRRTKPSEVPRRTKPKRPSPLDVPTVVGWDNPAAQPAASSGRDQWARLAALMEAERSEAQEQRRRIQRNMVAALAVVLGFVLTGALWMLLR